MCLTSASKFAVICGFVYMDPFYATNVLLFLLKHKKTLFFYLFIGGIERDQWHKLVKGVFNIIIFGQF